ncbi:MAG: hypothetical protein WA317_07925, partial [Mycobacterium sp.]|uniref:hypothetical protein n=1 Tax=Mycobacterium sp. TaxID=1785 RepID=UPI003CC61C98
GGSHGHRGRRSCGRARVAAAAGDQQASAQQANQRGAQAHRSTVPDGDGATAKVRAGLKSSCGNPYRNRHRITPTHTDDVNQWVEMDVLEMWHRFARQRERRLGKEWR